MQTYSKRQLTLILSALAGAEKRPANANEARRGIAKRCVALSLGIEPVLDAAPSLLDGNEAPASWVDRLQAEAKAAPAIDDEVTFEDTGEDQDEEEAAEIEIVKTPIEPSHAGDTDEQAGTSLEAAPVAPRPPREGYKMAALAGLLRRPEGADMNQMVEATGWQKHTIRAALSRDMGRRFGLSSTSVKEDGRRIYRTVPSAA